MSFRPSKRIFPAAFFICAILFSASCSGAAEAEALIGVLNNPSKQQLAAADLSPSTITRLLGRQALYFAGQHCLEAGLEGRAADLFEAGKKSGEPFARLCFLRLTEMGESSHRLAAAERFYRQYPQDGEARIMFAEQLYQSQKYERALELAAVLPAGELSVTEQNNLEKIRLLCLLEQDNPQFLFFLRLWFVNYDISLAHRDFYRIFSGHKRFEELKVRFSTEFEPLVTLMQMRLAVFPERNYAKAFSLLEQLDLPFEQFSASMLSDAGKIHLYGGKTYAQAALLFEEAAKKRDQYARFIAHFYAGRLYERAANYEASLASFLRAMQDAPAAENYDNALWYYFDAVGKQSVTGILPALAKYAPTWNDPAYFDDFLDTAAYMLLSRSMWDEFVAVWRILPQKSGESAAKYAYITARLLEENLAKNPDPQNSRETMIRICLQAAYSGDHENLYYRFLAADRLSVPLEDLSANLIKRAVNLNFTPDADMEALLRAYAQFGFAERVYAEYAKKPRSISIKTAVELSKKIASFGSANPRLYSDALRLIASSAAKTATITREILELLYPRPFLEETQAAASRFGNPEYILFGLIRSESFFEKDVVSHAGAVGLTQLMRPTAADIAARLRIKEYDLLDPLTNITFGSWYYENMLSRLDNSPILALFAYNGGITRVRSWVKNSNLPRDLFLETLPFSETREYGRKVLAASAIYGYLYYDKTPHEIVNEIMR